MDDASYFLVIRLGPKTSECEKNVTVVSTVTSCDVSNCATKIHGFNKHHVSGRAAELEHLFHSNDFDIISIQEGRILPSSRRFSSHHLCFTLSDCPVGFSQTQDFLRSRNPVG